jgi:hypothetical protein
MPSDCTSITPSSTGVCRGPLGGVLDAADLYGLEEDPYPPIVVPSLEVTFSTGLSFCPRVLGAPFVGVTAARVHPVCSSTESGHHKAPL